MRKRLRLQTILLVSLSIGAGCYQPIEGCLDADATNYNPEADDDCCCTYPVLKLDLTYSFDTLNFVVGEVFPHTRHDSFKILDFGVLLSQFKMGVSGGLVEVGQETAFFVKNGQDSLKQNFHDAFVLFRNKFRYEVGLLTVSDQYNSLSFSTGLSADRNDILPAGLASDHDLKYLLENGYWSRTDGYRTAFADVAYGPDLGDTLHWSTNYVAFQDDVELTLDTFKRRGENLTIDLDFEVKTWMGDVDFTVDEAQLTSELKDRLKSSIKIR